MQTNPQDDGVLQHWIASADAFTFPPQDFYSALEKKVEECQIPGLEMSRKEISEGGLLSNKRVYLRMLRKRLGFDICAAPFGSRFFFSCRTIYLPARVKLWHCLLLLFILGTSFYILRQFLDMAFSALAEAGLIVAIAIALRDHISEAMSDIDSSLLNTPFIGPLYARLRSRTYYREDTEIMFLDTVPKLVRELAESVCATKGVQLVRQFERAPILGELYKPPQFGMGSAARQQPQSK